MGINNATVTIFLIPHTFVVYDTTIADPNSWTAPHAARAVIPRLSSANKDVMELTSATNDEVFKSILKQMQAKLSFTLRISR